MKHIPSPIRLYPILVLALALAACGGAPGAEPTPPTIHYGEDICDICGMIISEERHAASYVTEDGVGHAFDDIGDKENIQNEEDSLDDPSHAGCSGPGCQRLW
jgi:nitrous oxide reductase accessory protein NosL